MGGFPRQWEPELVHHPVGLRAFPGTSDVVDQGLLEADAVVGLFGRMYQLVDAGRFPKPGPRDSVGPYAVPVLSPSHAEEVPFFLPNGAYFFKFFTIRQ